MALQPTPTGAGTPSHLVRCRAAYHARAWRQAFDELTADDVDRRLSAADLDRLGMSAYLIDRDDDALDAFERAHARHLKRGAAAEAARCAFWLSLGLLNRGEQARANGWVARGQRLLPEAGRCVERGYLLVPGVLINIGANGDLDAVFTHAEVIAEAGARFGDVELVSFALHAQGRIRIRQNRVGEGLALLDEAMAAVAAGEVTAPIFTGLIYCQVIDACEEVFDVGRAEQWTAALQRWCDSLSQMATFSGICQVHRAAILQMHGAWPAAVDEARQACARSGPDQATAGAARYREAEIQRCAVLSPMPNRPTTTPAHWAGNHSRGWRSCDCTGPHRRRGGDRPSAARRDSAPGAAGTNPAGIDRDHARRRRPVDSSGWALELAAIAADYVCDAFVAMRDYAIGAVELADHHPSEAPVSLWAACEAWQAINAPYEVARTRTLLGLACRELGDDDSALRELTTARETFRRLGAAPDTARVTALIDTGCARAGDGLTARELKVLRLVAEGQSNKAIATRLTLSERTVDHHVSNILMKLGVPSRTAATAYAYTHRLV